MSSRPTYGIEDDQEPGDLCPECDGVVETCEHCAQPHCRDHDCTSFPAPCLIAAYAESHPSP